MHSNVPAFQNGTPRGTRQKYISALLYILVFYASLMLFMSYSANILAMCQQRLLLCAGADNDTDDRFIHSNQ